VAEQVFAGDVVLGFAGGSHIARSAVRSRTNKVPKDPATGTTTGLVAAPERAALNLILRPIGVVRLGSRRSLRSDLRKQFDFPVGKVGKFY
jgi:hypothetical protein